MPPTPSPPTPSPSAGSRVRRLLADAVDAALDASIFLGFTRVGSALRRRLDGWSPFAPGALDGQVVVITGATSGLGLAAARAAGRLGAHLELLGRDPEKTARVVAMLRADGLSVGAVVGDMSEQADVRDVARELAARHDHIDALVHNAGALEAQYATSAEGIERTVASQVLGPFLLTDLLRDRITAAPHGRIVWVASGGMYSQPLEVDSLEMARDDYDGTKAYARAKRAQVTLATLWAERLAGTPVTVHAMHPGWADTPGVARSLPTFRKVVGPLLRSAEDGADTLVWLLASDEPREASGSFWHDRRPRPRHRLRSTRRSDTPEERARLWEWCRNRTDGDRADPAG